MQMVNIEKTCHLVSIVLLIGGYYWGTNFNKHIYKLYIDSVSMQGYFLTTVFFIFSLFTDSTRSEANNKINNFKDILFQISLILEVIITVGYHIIMLPYLIAVEKPEQLISYQNYIHRIPVTILIIQILFSHVRFPAKHLKHLLGVGFLIILTNFLITKFDRPVYFFLKYQRLEEILIIPICAFAMVIFFLLFNRLAYARDLSLRRIEINRQKKK